MIVEKLEASPNPVDIETAHRLVERIRRIFPTGREQVDDQKMNPEDKADLYLLDGKMIGHAVLGHGYQRRHYWTINIPKGMV